MHGKNHICSHLRTGDARGKSAERIARNSFAELFETKGQLVASPVHVRVGTMTFTLRAGNTTFLKNRL